jgi:hypothetical protein
VVDPDSGYALSEIYCGLFSLKEIKNKIGIKDDVLSHRQPYILDIEQINKSMILFDSNIEHGDNEVHLISWSPEDGLPYRVHSNRELILMSYGLKPLAVFSATIPQKKDFIEIPDYLFRPYVENGIFICREICESLSGEIYKGFRVVLYALKQEEWRIDAYLLVRSLARKIGWSEPLIRMEGTLLGYSEWENDAFISNMNIKNQGMAS